MSLKQKVLVPGGRDLGGFFEIFEILGGAGDMNNSISMPNYCDGPHIRLLRYPRQISSAWTEVWTGTCRSSRRFWFPDVAIWAIFFLRFLRFWEGLVI